MLAGTLRENLLYALPGASDEALAAVIEEARLAQTLARLPNGLDTEIGDRGRTLSGGERQRLAIARAVLVIAHRLSTVVAAHQIVVLDRGRVRAIGSHAELIEGNSLYRKLAATQLIAPD